ncbi:hypothetical protein LA76x_0484 [Lysobacter antibioticus]|uniref:Uncharacterized protein n=1 Tax=Lysobacter antibioticus TaxID=84531 RepID=A0A0S2F510_LYSAN|nr:hypothetical protein LA76x_0484 [Lysobacter antibioticus]
MQLGALRSRVRGKDSGASRLPGGKKACLSFDVRFWSATRRIESKRAGP